MITAFSRNRELRVRRAILKGIYEDNLKIIGKREGAALHRHRPFYLKKAYLAFFLTVAVVLGHGGTITNSYFPGTRAGAAHEASAGSPGASAGPSDYKTLINDPQMPVSKVFGLGVRTIMLDPGHGGNDTGAIGKMGTREKEIALDIAKRLRDRLKKYQMFDVRMTREEDVTVPLNKRVESALAARTDLFVSIHLNYLPSKPINIIETYYFGPSSDEKTYKLAEQENAGSEYVMSDFKDIIGKIGHTLRLQESKELALSIQKNLFSNMKDDNLEVYDFGVKRAPFVVLLGVDIPAVLAEVSCLSNREEELKLNTGQHRENIASYLEAGILDYINKGEIHYEAKRHAAK
jgi:N-acetylmuramoyl-L-alanine amidase